MPPTLHIETADAGHLRVVLSGAWTLDQTTPDPQRIIEILAGDASICRIGFETSGLTAWDTALPVFLLAIQKHTGGGSVMLDTSGLPEGARRLVTLATAVPVPDQGATGSVDGLLVRIGKATQRLGAELVAILGFLGETVLALWAWIRGRARYRRTDLGLLLQDVGPRALPIVTLISFLVGVILAFVGAVQLARFGAEIFIADLVGLAMAREMGPMMAAVIMAGRTGAAFAAQIGTMQVNQEVDALRTLGISPIEFLVLPRVIALVVMMPLLTLYAILVGIFGGLIVSVNLFDVTLIQYWNATLASLNIEQFVIGLSKSLVFGVLIAIAGCYQGIKTGGSAAAVGAAATAAVVSAIVAIVVADGVFAVLLNALEL
ncbi:ABC transporter permease [Thioalkalicoccus limnaeus]|uniref:ABC transporter permease n=1 Tax=Thioalkalicoccus limnaeus TaxID=120681 RepID=A0ABV4BJY3_9GAMM